jgi:VanZ family protein
VNEDHGDTAGTSPSKTRPNVASRWAVNAGYAILLVVMAVIPQTTVAAVSMVPDWFAHASAYGIQTGLLFWALAPLVGVRSALVGGLLGAVSFGAVTEVLQVLQPGRAVEFRDVVANSVGAMVVCVIIASAVVLRSRRSG